MTWIHRGTITEIKTLRLQKSVIILQQQNQDTAGDQHATDASSLF